MALEKTVLDAESIRTLLNERYAITVQTVRRLPLGSANCYTVSDGKQTYFLKEFQSKITEENVLREASLVEHLYQQGFPVARFLRTVDGEVLLTRQGHVICLEEFIEGQSYGYNDLPTALLPEVARTLGKLHAALRAFPLPTHRGDDWLRTYSAETVRAQYDDLLAIAAQHPQDAHIERIIADLQFKKELATRCEQVLDWHNGITYTPSHGDFQGCQLVWHGETVKAVIDFSAARTLPAVWEVMRSYVQSSAACRANPVIDIDGLCAYTAEYRRFFPLTRTDLAAMPYVYLCQLARSRFGYTQYLTTDSEDRAGLLDFAFWRTAMCREVERKAHDIQTALLS